MKLSIIIPYYNAGAYTRELLKILDKQMTEGVEVILIDDGSSVPFKADYDWLTIKRKKNGGASSARNMGLDLAQGDYVSFIDADDLVADNYIKTILAKIEKEHFDYCYISWKTLPGGWVYQVKLNSVADKFPPFNLCVWNRIYKKDMIGDMRFNTKKAIAEDAEFIRKVKESGKKKAYISEFMYFYRTEQRDSLTKKFANGQLDMNRIVYYFQTVSKSMRYLIKEFKKADEYAEVILMTTKNEIKELEEYAMVIPPQEIKGTELRGEPTRLFKKIEKPLKTQVVIWTAFTQEIGGIETWIYEFSRVMREYYDIVVLYDTISPAQLARLQKLVRCVKVGRQIVCDTCIISRITDKVPASVQARQTVQMVHACKMLPQWTIPQDRDHIAAVSNAVLDSFKAEGEVIYNLVDKPTSKKCLTLISATRLSKTSAFEKGHRRMLQLAEMLEKADMPYIWLMFSDEGFREKHNNMIILPPTLDIAPYIAKADYYVSLSDAEGWGYSVIEALINKTPVITTPVSVLPEIGFKDKQDGYIVPFDMNFDVKKLKKIPKVKFEWDNQGSIDKWREVLGDSEPLHDYDPQAMVSITIIKPYFDTQLERKLNKNELINVTQDRANLIINAGYGRIG